MQKFEIWYFLGCLKSSQLVKPWNCVIVVFSTGIQRLKIPFSKLVGRGNDQKGNKTWRAKPTEKFDGSLWLAEKRNNRKTKHQVSGKVREKADKCTSQTVKSLEKLQQEREAFSYD